MIPEIQQTQQSKTDTIFCHSVPFFALLPLMDPENQNFGKMNITTEDNTILQMCAINDSHMMYGS